MLLLLADCGLRIADCGLRIADCGLRNTYVERLATKMESTPGRILCKEKNERKCSYCGDKKLK